VKASLPDIKPFTPVRALDREFLERCAEVFPFDLVCEVVGMSASFVRKVIRHRGPVNARALLTLLDQDAFAETFVPRSAIPNFLMSHLEDRARGASLSLPAKGEARHIHGDAHKLIDRLPAASVACVVTSTPYWGTRIYDHAEEVTWADGERCPFGHEQTPEGFIRHSVEMLWKLKRTLRNDGSIWWNLMDSFNTRTQIRTNAAEALRAMQGKDKKSWKDHDCRRHSAGHSFLKDGEQCGIPGRIAERASRIGLYVKTTITWAKTGSLPEPQNSRVSRALEYILHLTKVRTPYFKKEAYLRTPARVGGRNNGLESSKLSDVWLLSTTAGRDGHGAQFPLALPGRCIAISTKEDDLVLDPFSGGGTSGVASKILKRRFLGFDVSPHYVAIAESTLAKISGGANAVQTVLEL
jgi:DNA modification methylase